MVYSKNIKTLIIKYLRFTFSLHLFTFDIFSYNLDIINKIKYIFAQHIKSYGKAKDRRQTKTDTGWSSPVGN